MFDEKNKIKSKDDEASLHRIDSSMKMKENQNKYEKESRDNYFGDYEGNIKETTGINDKYKMINQERSTKRDEYEYSDEDMKDFENIKEKNEGLKLNGYNNQSLTADQRDLDQRSGLKRVQWTTQW